MDISKIDFSTLKLKKDNLKDCNIVLYYQSDFTESFLYNIIQENFPAFQKIFQVTEENGISTLSKYFLSDGMYKIGFIESKLCFNIVSKYPGWQEYGKFIFDVIKTLGGHINYKGCSLEYASFHENMDIFDNIDGVVKLNKIPQLFDGTTLSFSFPLTEKIVGDLSVKVDVLLRQGVYLDGKRCSLTAIKVGTEKNSRVFDYTIAQEWLDTLHDVQVRQYLEIMHESYINKCR